ncbi:hypothetical protein V6N12_023694 [Hibiscus sabdariffa]|uniref:Uncharacterized protein n=1 Tax=Hibiscus sabdariffa TaxID=183260 RepID=A0ABR2FYJ3_9ROSI
MTVDTRRHRNAIPPTHNRNATSRNQCGGVDTRSRFSALVVDEDVDKGVLGLPTDGSAPREAVVVGSAKNTSSLNMIALPQVQVEPNAAYMKSNPAKKLRVVARTIERLEQVVVQVDQDVVVISQNKAGKFDQHTAVTLQLEMTSTSAQPSANRDMSCPFIGVGHDPPKGGSTTTHIGDQSPSVQDDPSNGQKTMEIELELAALHFYDNLFQQSNVDGDLFNVRGYFPVVSREDLDALGSPISDDEIKAALFGMRSLKALGVDGLHALL